VRIDALEPGRKDLLSKTPAIYGTSIARPGPRPPATKGKEEEIRPAAMRAWTIEHGKNDAANPYSGQNYAGSPEWIARFRSAGALDPVKNRF
jgi:hypothetical protein